MGEWVKREDKEQKVKRRETGGGRMKTRNQKLEIMPHASHFTPYASRMKF
jgi:hypothetical protein